MDRELAARPGNGNSDAPPPMAEMARLRQAAYKLIGHTLLYPRTDAFQEAAAAARELQGGFTWASWFSFYPAWTAFVTGLAETSAADIDDLRKDHHGLFGGNSSAAWIPLTESECLGQDMHDSGWVLASISQHYSSAGLAPTSATGESPDHISVEFEFMSFLCGREAEAWEDRDFKSARRAVSRERRFVERHPANWVPGVARGVMRRSSGLFALTASAAESLVVHDVDFLGAVRAHLRDSALPQSGSSQ